MSNLRLMILLGATMLAPFAASAQTCGNLSGNPSPTPEVYAANLVQLRYIATGPGGGDDRPRLKKSASNNPSFLGLDLAATHSLTVTIRRGSNVGPVMWVGTVPAGSGLWTSVTLPNGVVRWTLNDPTVTYGIRRARVLDYGGGLYIIDRFFGQNQNIANAPVTAGVDPVHVLVEFYDGSGAGACYDGGTAPCTGTGNTQKCKVL